MGDTLCDALGLPDNLAIRRGYPSVHLDNRQPGLVEKFKMSGLV